MNRREFIKTGLLFTTAVLTPKLSKADVYEKRLKLYHIHTGEYLDVIFWVDGDYIFEELDRLEIFFRDYRNDEIYPIDIELIEYLYSIKRALNYTKEFNILSAYRSAKTNSYLRKHQKGVAKNSFHMYGRAVDFTSPNVGISYIKKAALSLRRGGVGYYLTSNFIHIDTGKPRYWRYPKI